MPLQDISHVFALSGNYVQARIRFVENSTNINGNYSNATIYIDVHRTNTGYTTSGSGTLSGWINDANGGRTVNFSHSFSASVSNSNWVTLYSTNVNISHNSTGGGNCSVGVSIDWQRDGSSSASFTMSTIPRAATISNVSNFTDEDNPGFSFSNPGNFNLECWLEPNPNGDHLAIRTVTKATSGTFTWDLTDEERAQLRQKCTGKTCTIRVGLYSNDKAFASYKDVTYSIINANPILGDNSWQTTNHLDLVNSDTVIKGKSNIDVVVNGATPKKEATIKQYKVVIGSQIKTSESPTTFSFENIDTSIINIYVEDSRGFVSSEILNISNFIDYVEPDILSLSAERSDGGIGSSAILSYKASMWIGNFGKKENTITVQYFYKKNGDSTWVQGLTDITPESISSSFENSEEILGDLGALGFEQSSTYDVKIIITDMLGSIDETKVGCIPSGTPEMAFAKKGVAFNGFYDIDGKGVQFKGNVYDANKNKVHLPIVDVIVEQGYSNEWYYRKWESGIAECWRNHNVTFSENGTWGSLYTQQFDMTSDFPFEFSEIPTVNVNLIECSSGYNGWIVTYLEKKRISKIHPGAYQYVRGTAGTSGTATLSYYVIGKWK